MPGAHEKWPTEMAELTSPEVQRVTVQLLMVALPAIQIAPVSCVARQGRAAHSERYQVLMWRASNRRSTVRSSAKGVRRCSGTRPAVLLVTTQPLIVALPRI